MDLVILLGAIFSIWLHPCTGSKLFSAEDFYEPRGQRVCRRGTERPCYKIAYFQDASRKLNFEEASGACRSDGGELLSIESENEQKLVENFIQELRASDGDFWIGLRRKQGYQDSTADCPGRYYWLDGSKATFRKWHWDEPSCGNEVCVVMYHQPSAPPGIGGLYMFQWNDDNCDTRNNFICKYSQEKAASSTSAGSSAHTDAPAVSLGPKHPAVTVEGGKDSVLVTDSKGNVLNIVYIIIPTIPLLLLLVVTTGVFCFKLFARRKERTETSKKEPHFWMSPNRCSSPSLEVYSVIQKQRPADLEGTRPDIKNTSFRASSGHDLSGDYDNMSASNSERGESGFVNNDIYETSSSGRKESGWVDNDIYGY
ncbi:layilin-like isoform X3 [Acipenser ruthenus]|uniref:layilin-like isoform X3 n=1 Tax=Acipenser ruthenus TaxID=7906 RepID=UPI002740EC9F|nr:layilin-like isoform X3 [Acipenser ruthenus]